MDVIPWRSPATTIVYFASDRKKAKRKRSALFVTKNQIFTWHVEYAEIIAAVISARPTCGRSECLPQVPVISHLFPNNQVFAGKLLRGWIVLTQAIGPDFACSGRTKRFHVETSRCAGSGAWPAMFFHIAPIAARPVTMADPVASQLHRRCINTRKGKCRPRCRARLIVWRSRRGLFRFSKSSELVDDQELWLGGAGPQSLSSAWLLVSSWNQTMSAGLSARP